MIGIKGGFSSSNILKQLLKVMFQMVIKFGEQVFHLIFFVFVIRVQNVLIWNHMIRRNFNLKYFEHACDSRVCLPIPICFKSFVSSLQCYCYYYSTSTSWPMPIQHKPGNSIIYIHIILNLLCILFYFKKGFLFVCSCECFFFIFPLI